MSLLNITREQRDQWALVATLALAFTLALVLLKPVFMTTRPLADAGPATNNSQIHFVSKQ